MIGIDLDQLVPGIVKAGDRVKVEGIAADDDVTGQITG